LPTQKLIFSLWPSHPICAKSAKASSLLNPCNCYHLKKKTIQAPSLPSVIDGMKGNAGKGLKSGVSGKNGHTKVTEGCSNVIIEDRLATRDGDEVCMNGKAG
jgi:hypothetical protein